MVGREHREQWWLWAVMQVVVGTGMMEAVAGKAEVAVSMAGAVAGMMEAEEVKKVAGGVKMVAG